jgi:hypothetical protein
MGWVEICFGIYCMFLLQGYGQNKISKFLNYLYNNRRDVGDGT